MIHTYDNWLNESTNIRIRLADAIIERLKTELKQYSNFTKDYGKFEDWWSVTEKDYKDEDPAYLDSLERVQRNTPENKRFRGDIYFLEFHVKLNQNTSSWKLCTMNLVDFTLKIHEDLSAPIRIDGNVVINPLGEKVRKIFDETLQEMYPGAFHGSKFKL